MRGNSGRGSHELSLAASRLIFEARCELADFFERKTRAALPLLPTPPKFELGSVWKPESVIM